MKVKQFLIILIVFLSVNGCGMTEDLMKARYTLNKARHSVQVAGDHPALNEHRLKNSAEICLRENDKQCLALAYELYGHLYRSNTIRVEQNHYEEKGFVEPNVTFENRFEHSAKHFEKAISYWDHAKDHKEISTLYIQLSLSYHLIEDIEKECLALEKSLQYHFQAYPEDDMPADEIPMNFERFSDYILQLQSQAGCASKPE
ncbi:hypothetical protein [Pseudoalteromonas luteoviolacea]|uniref:Uncharacterized protein n=1 Tax=Pseudoalteromonas luteoviolacea H33 TaxID=1365251 RepID=A0A167EKS8_9GAMM|nr:hypothetical protein [Pseudoalteromonas luteoviolacea]KZN50898.1 hypothetical protein N476_14750 [Pseudoalteromonas luteoviolacea H33]KZN74972.1 hypothetical protein N477_20390 [Pseudoalteromonas luteoviolacea H33-S]MBQ4879860.1 hypothetical protein [Pseudoalteromonas luteoviolacea]MBQ4908622.1 hypothetical protein [Pseudoalteromonas luteoviolacea]